MFKQLAVAAVKSIRGVGRMVYGVSGWSRIMLIGGPHSMHTKHFETR